MNVRMLRLLAMIAFGALFGLSACASRQPSHEAAPEGLLAGTAWRLQQLGSEGALEGHQPTLIFGQFDRVNGTGSCNRFNGSVVVDRKSITFGPLASTRMACEAAISTQEANYFKALQQAEWFTISGSALTIYTKAMDLPLVFVSMTTPEATTKPKQKTKE